MRIIFLGNNWVGWQVLSWLNEQAEEVVGLVTHPPDRRKYGEEIMNCVQVEPKYIFDALQLHHPMTLDAIKALQPDIGISAFFGYILRPDFLTLMPAGCVNVHSGLLPHNRGAYPNVWSIVDETPAGATLHYMDPEVDTGDVIAQRAVTVDPIDTGESLYRKLERACVDLFKDTWPLVRTGQSTRTLQQQFGGSYHSSRDVEAIDEIDLEKTYKARELINAIRARTFPPYPGTYFWHEGRKVYIRLQLMYEDHVGG